MNASRYISVLDDYQHVLNFMSIHGCTTSKRLGTMPQSQISHELVSHQKCHNAQMAGNSPDLNPIENLRTLIKKKVSTSNPTTLDELKQIIKRFGAQIMTKMSANT